MQLSSKLWLCVLNYSKKYQKAKNSIDVLHQQIELTEKEIDYFDSLITAMSQASYYDALEIKEELENEGYLKKKKQHKLNSIYLSWIDTAGKLTNSLLTFLV